MGFKATDIYISLYSTYLGLYHSIRDLPPLTIIIKEVIENLGIDIDNPKFLSSFTAYEENNGAIFVSTSTSMTPISKHIGIKYNWFR